MLSANQLRLIIAAVLLIIITFYVFIPWQWITTRKELVRCEQLIEEVSDMNRDALKSLNQYEALVEELLLRTRDPLERESIQLDNHSITEAGRTDHGQY